MLVLVAQFPALKQPATWRDTTWFVGSMGAASCLLRPVCRKLAGRKLPWLALEVRAFFWSLLAGAAASIVTDLVLLRKMDWIWLGDLVQYSVVLFLWSSLYFSICSGRRRRSNGNACCGRSRKRAPPGCRPSATKGPLEFYAGASPSPGFFGRISLPFSTVTPWNGSLLMSRLPSRSA